MGPGAPCEQHREHWVDAGSWIKALKSLFVRFNCHSAAFCRLMRYGQPRVPSVTGRRLVLTGTWVLLVSTRAHRELDQLNPGSDDLQGVFLAA